MHKTTLTPRQLLCSVQMEKSYLGKAGFFTMGNLPLETASGQRKTRVNSNRHQTINRGKVYPRSKSLIRPGLSSCVPRVHVNRPLLQKISCITVAQ